MEHISQELGGSLGFEKTVLVHVEVVPGILEIICYFVVTELLVRRHVLVVERQCVVLVEEIVTRKLSSHFDFSGIVSNYGVHKSVVALLRESVWNASGVASV